MILALYVHAIDPVSCMVYALNATANNALLPPDTRLEAFASLANHVAAVYASTLLLPAALLALILHYKPPDTWPTFITAITLVAVFTIAALLPYVLATIDANACAAVLGKNTDIPPESSLETLVATAVILSAFSAIAIGIASRRRVF